MAVNAASLNAPVHSETSLNLSVSFNLLPVDMLNFLNYNGDMSISLKSIAASNLLGLLLLGGLLLDSNR